MTTSKNALENSTVLTGGASIARLFGGRFGARIALEAPNEGAAGGAGDEAAKAAAAKAAADAAAAAAAAAAEKARGEGEKLSDREAELLKDVMSKKKKVTALETELAKASESLKQFEGIDPVAIKDLLQKQKDAEVKALEAKGDFDRLKTMMATEHAADLKKIQDASAGKDSELAKALATINDLTIGSSFASSPFVSEELVLTPNKARVIYGDHFEVDGASAVAYDKPKGHPDRTKLVDGQGNPLGFEAAIKKLVDADPDRERIMKSKMQPGAGSKTTDTTTTTTSQGDLSKLTGMARIQASLASGKAFGKK